MEPNLLPVKELSNSSPKIFKDILLLSPGEWNGINYTPDELHKAFINTNWNDKSNTHLYLDHQDTKERGVGNWAGFVKNQRMVGDSLFGDLEVWHPLLATWLGEAKAKFGVSATLRGSENKLENKMVDFHYESWSIVTSPGCEVAWINLGKEEKEGKTVTVSVYKTEEFKNQKSNLIELEGGLKKMTEEEKKLEEEAKEEVEEAKEEEPKAEVEEEAKEEVKENSEEEAKAESEEESKESEAESEVEVKVESSEEESKSDSESESLSADISALNKKFDELFSLFEKSLAMKEKEASKVAEVKKDLSILKKEVDDAPQVRTLSASYESDRSDEDTNMGMLQFLKARNY